MANVKTVKELHHELYLYHCAGGRTRAEMAERVLVDAGFRFEGTGIARTIYWPDGERVAYAGGDIVYREWKTRKPVTPQVPALPGVTPLGLTKEAKRVKGATAANGLPASVSAAGRVTGSPEQHSPLPWNIQHKGRAAFIEAAKLGAVPVAQWMTDADAALAVRAVNSYAELLELARAIVLEAGLIEAAHNQPAHPRAWQNSGERWAALAAAAIRSAEAR